MTSAHPTTNHQNTLKTIKTLKNSFIFWPSHIFGWTDEWKPFQMAQFVQTGTADLPLWIWFYKFMDQKRWSNFDHFTRLTSPRVCFADSSLISSKLYHEKSQKSHRTLTFSAQIKSFSLVDISFFAAKSRNILAVVVWTWDIMAAQEDPENKVDLNDISFGFRAWVWRFARVTVTDGPIYCADIYS